MYFYFLYYENITFTGDLENNKVTYSSTILQFFKIHKYFQLEFQYQTLKNQQNEQTEKQKDIVDLKSTMNQFNIIKIYTIFIQQQDTNSIQVPVDYRLGDTETYPGT